MAHVLTRPAVAFACQVPVKALELPAGMQPGLCDGPDGARSLVSLRAPGQLNARYRYRPLAHDTAGKRKTWSIRRSFNIPL